MKKESNLKKVANQPVQKAIVVATSAVSLSLLGSSQHPLLAEGPQTQTFTQSDCQDDTAAFRKFGAQGYTYCDAKVLAAYWGEKSALDAKTRLGNKMLSFGPADGKEHVLRARAKALKKPANLPCTYADGGYNYKDAVLLGKYWGTSEPNEAKLKMALLLVLGSDAVIKAAMDAAEDGE